MISNKEILDNAPDGAEEYSYETKDLFEAYYKGNREHMYIPHDDWKVSWSYCPDEGDDYEVEYVSLEDLIRLEEQEDEC